MSSNPEGNSRFNLRRSLLKDQASERLRELLLEGVFKPGSKIPARKVMELLGIGRMPARDALLELQRDGLVTNHNGGRYCVVELDEQTRDDLYDVRLRLERRAVELATRNARREDHAMFSRKFNEMKEACGRKDIAAVRRADIELHRLIWRLSNNPILEKILNYIGDLIFFGHMGLKDLDEVALERWSTQLDKHRDLVERINSGDTRAAMESIDHHVQRRTPRDSRSLMSSEGTA